MNELTITVSGWVATDPKFLVGAQGARMTTFRLASSARYFDREKGSWVDGGTEWFTVRVFRGAAALVNESVAKGQPVVVHGRFRTSTWQSESGPRTDLIIDATGVGHDLTRGTATFQRAQSAQNLPPEAYPRVDATSGTANPETDAPGATERLGAGDFVPGQEPDAGEDAGFETVALPTGDTAGAEFASDDADAADQDQAELVGV